jgi:hypothetical protein
LGLINIPAIHLVIHGQFIQEAAQHRDVSRNGQVENGTEQHWMLLKGGKSGLDTLTKYK